MPYSVDITNLPKDASEEVIHKYIILEIEARFDGYPHSNPERSYLLQCANWAPDNRYQREVYWIPYSPILQRYSDGTLMGTGYWPLYSINLKYSQKTSIEFHSWKGDYPTEQYKYNPEGNLPYEGTYYNYSGTVWTRG